MKISPLFLLRKDRIATSTWYLNVNVIQTQRFACKYLYKNQAIGI